MKPDTQALIAAVQRNCHIADAAHAQGYTLCIYLLKMREYYRWEKGFSMTDSLPKEELGEWLEARERLWDGLSAADFSRLPLGGREVDPFESERVNQALIPEGLIYSGGYGGCGVPHFFLGQLLRRETREGFEVLVSGTEYARDLAAPPAMLQGRSIFVRRESLRRLLWERIEEWNWKRGAGPMEKALAHYAFENDTATALEAMTDHELDVAVLHELGECRAGERLGDEWHAMLAAFAATKAEHIARAVRDHLADSLTTLPALLEQDNRASLHFYAANFRGMRREIYPEWLDAYRHWEENSASRRLQETVAAGAERWGDVAQQLLELYRQHGAEAAPLIAAQF